LASADFNQKYGCFISTPQTRTDAEPSAALHKTNCTHAKKPKRDRTWTFHQTI
jgi:hypothetical protein